MDKGSRFLFGSASQAALATAVVVCLFVAATSALSLAGIAGPAAGAGAAFVENGAGVTGASNQSIPNNVVTEYTQTLTEDYDVGSGYFVPGSLDHGFIVPAGRAGRHEVSGFINWAGNSTGYRGAQVQVNDAVGTPTIVDRIPAGVANNVHQNFSAILDLAAGDEVTVHVEQTSGGALNALLQGFAINRISP